MDDGEGTALSHCRLGVANAAGAAISWTERDIRGVEVRAVSTHLEVEAERFDIILGPLLVLECERTQVQALLEQAWSRLQVLREDIVDVRSQAAAASTAEGPHNAERPLAQAQDALNSSTSSDLSAAREALESAFEGSSDAGEFGSSIRALQALAAAASFDFSSAATFSQEAAVLAGSNAELHWRNRVQQAQFLLDHGREFNDSDALRTLTTLCEETLLPIAADTRENADSAWVYDCLGQAIGILGRRHSGTAMLDDAVHAFESALELRDRATKPYDWAATQNHLGNAIGSLGQRQHDLELLDRAAAAFQAALEVPVSNAAPEARASAQSNLAAVLQTIGQQRQDPEAFDQAIEAYRAALLIWNSDRKPLFWAATQSNLGAALRVLGGIRDDDGLLEQSVDAYQASLTARTRQRMPAEWAITQNDLGAALQVLGEKTEDALVFGRAIAAFREALLEISRENEPMTWALTTANLGVARRKYAEYRYDVDASRRAVRDIQAALDVFRGASHSPLTGLGLEQLAIAMEVNAELEAPSED